MHTHRLAPLPAVFATLLAAIAFVAPLGARAAAFAADLAVGDAAPDFTLKDQDGKDVKLSSFAGKKAVVIAFFPAAQTPGCTKEMTCFTHDIKKIEDRDATVLAISVDTVAKQRDFATGLGAKFPLLSDESRAVSKLYQVLVADTGGGYASRSTFVVDKAGKIAWVQRDFAVPTALESSPLLAALDKITKPAADPADAFAKLPSPEREIRTLVVRFLEAYLREQIPVVQGHLHPDYGWRASEPLSSWKARKDTEVGLARKLFAATDLRTTTLDQLLDVSAGRVLARGDASKPGRAGGLREIELKTAMMLAEGDLIVSIPTKPLKFTDAKSVEWELFPKSFAAVVRKDGEIWKILEIIR